MRNISKGIRTAQSILIVLASAVLIASVIARPAQSQIAQPIEGEVLQNDPVDQDNPEPPVSNPSPSTDSNPVSADILEDNANELPEVIVTAPTPADQKPSNADSSNETFVPTTAATSTAIERQQDTSAVEGYAAGRKLRRELENGRFHRVQDIIRDSPNVNIQGFGDGRSTVLSARGVGPLVDALSPDESSFVVHIDGVPQPLFGADNGFLDLEQTHLLLGPQGTRFGKNTTAGSLNLITRKPTDEPEFILRSEFGDDGHTLAEAIASGPLISQVLAGRLALRFSDINGFTPNTLTGNDLGEQKILSARGTLRYTPDIDTSMTLTFATDHDHRTFPFFLLRDTPEFPIASLIEDNTSRRRINSGTVTIEQKQDTFSFRSITNLTQIKTSDFYIDDTDGFTFSKLTGLPQSVFAVNNTFTDWIEDQQTFSQQFLFKSLPGTDIEWFAGTSYFHSHFSADYLNESAISPRVNGRRLNELASDSFSGFGEVTFQIAQGLNFTTGARATHERKTYDLQYFGIGTPGTVAAFRDFGDLNFSFITGRTSLAYDIDSTQTAYVSVARGFKSGGFPRLVINASLGVPTDPFSSTQTWTYEAGYKYTSPLSSAYFEATAFYNDVSKEHLLVFDPLAINFFPANVDIISYGVEVSTKAKLSENISVGGNLGYTKAEVVDVFSNQPVFGAGQADRPVNVPELTASATLEYSRPAREINVQLDGRFLGRISWNFVGDRAADLANSFFLDPYHLVNGRFGFEHISGLEIYAFGTNLLDETPEFAGAYIPPNVELAVPGRGRLVGLGVSRRW